MSGQFVPQLLPLFLQGACDGDDEVRSNAIYGLGVLGQNGEDFFNRIDENRVKYETCHAELSPYPIFKF